MKNQKKQKYVPCEVNVIKFNVEQGFAASPQQTSLVGTIANSQNTITLKQNTTNNDALNDKYNQQQDWFGAL